MGVIKIIAAPLILALSFTACSNPKNTIITKSNEDKVLSDVGPTLSNKERAELVAAIARSAFGSYSIEGKSIGQVLADQKRHDDEEKAAQEVAHEAQVREERRRAAIEAKLNAALSIYPISKDFSPSNFDPDNGAMHGDQIVITFQIHNKTKKPIKEFEGTTHFENSFGDSIESNKLDYTDTIPAGAIVTYTGVLDYNEFMDNDQKLRSTPLSDMKFTFSPKGITFADGSQLVAPSSGSDGY